MILKNLSTNTRKTRNEYLLIDQINDDINHLVSLRLLSIVLARKTKLLGKEPAMVVNEEGLPQSPCQKP